MFFLCFSRYWTTWTELIMAPTNKTYPAPSIPDTPSKAINDMLQSRCDRTFDNPVKYGLALCICMTFSAIVKVYQLLHREMKPSHTMWMAACGVISMASILKAVLLYYIVMACSFLLHSLLYYGCSLVALAGVGIGVAGAIFFDKDGTKQSPGFEPTRASSGYESSKLEWILHLTITLSWHLYVYIWSWIYN